MSIQEHSDREETEKEVRMDVSITPPPRCPVSFFGESHFMWAPKKPCPPPKESRIRRSARSLNFSGIAVDEEKYENRSLINQERKEYSRGTYEGTRLPTHENERNLHTPGRRLRSSLVDGRSPARRIDFAGLTLGQNEPGYLETALVGARTTSERLIGQMEVLSKRHMKRQAADETASTGNDKSAKGISKEKALSGIKKARLARLMR